MSRDDRWSRDGPGQRRPAGVVGTGQTADGVSTRARSLGDGTSTGCCRKLHDFKPGCLNISLSKYGYDKIWVFQFFSKILANLEKHLIRYANFLTFNQINIKIYWLTYILQYQHFKKSHPSSPATQVARPHPTRARSTENCLSHD